MERLNGARVLVLGDVMLDRFIYGDVSRISPEGPVPVLKSLEVKSVLGGAGNVVRNLAALGARTILLSLVGEDDEADQVRGLLAELPLVRSIILVDPDRRSTIKTRFLSRQQQLLRVDSETPHPINYGIVRSAVIKVGDLIEECETVILSDYGKGFLRADLLKETIALCRERGKPVLVDPKGLDYSIYAGASIMTPNLKELSEAAHMPVPDDDAVVAAARKLIEQCGLQAVLATRSQEGMSLIEAEGRVMHFRAEAKEVFDVTGAGDTVIAVLGAALASGAPLPEGAEIANIAAGIVVGKAGTAVAYVRDMIHAIRKQELTTAESKVLDLESAADRIELWKRKGYRIGFLNGFFELLHPAHIKLLSQASKECDRLIVGINSDSSICRIKGEHPILHEAARCAIVASLEDVDMVVIFQDDNPSRILEVLKPDVHIQRGHTPPDDAAAVSVGRGNGHAVKLLDLAESRLSAFDPLPPTLGKPI